MGLVALLGTRQIHLLEEEVIPLATHFRVVLVDLEQTHQSDQVLVILHQPISMQAILHSQLSGSINQVQVLVKVVAQASANNNKTLIHIIMCNLAVAFRPLEVLITTPSIINRISNSINSTSNF